MTQERFKYSRTYHLEFSEAVHGDDKVIPTTKYLEGDEVVATLKYDGESTSIYSDGYTHARSIDSKTNWTRDIVKKISSVIFHDIPENYRICCENLYAKHSIYYPDNYLEGYLYLLSIWDDKNTCLSWDDTVVYAELLDLPQPKVLYRGKFDIDKLKDIAKNLDLSIEEGFVVRSTSAIPYDDFSNKFCKFVRNGHVQPDAKHWLKTAIQNGTPKQPVKPAFLNTIKKNKP